MTTQFARDGVIFIIVDLPIAWEGPFNTWQKFKDVVRTALVSTGNQPGWTEMKPKYDGSAIGYTICKSNEHAKLIYEHLLNLPSPGRRASVHWYDTRYSKDAPYVCNCDSGRHRVNVESYRHHLEFLAQMPNLYMVTQTSPVMYSHPSPVWNMATIPGATDPVQSLTANLHGLAVGPAYVPTPSHLPIHPPVRGSYPHAPQYPPGYMVAPQEYYGPAAFAPSSYHFVHPPPHIPYAPVQPYPPGYVPNAQGLPVNASQGVVQKEYKVVIFKNLDPEVTEEELRHFIRKSVDPTRLAVKSPPEGKKHTTAIATFKSYRDAKEVVEYFKTKETQVRGRKLIAQVGKDPDPPKKVYTVVSSTLPNA